MSNYVSTFRWPINPQALNKVIQISNELNIHHDHLMGVMVAESNLNPQARNKNSRATGLIQFLPSTAQSLGTSVDALQKMNFIQQLDYVKQYFQPYAGNLSTLEDVYMAVLFPVAIGKGPNHVLFQSPSTAYQQNSGLDINGDGKITVGEATEFVRRKMKPYQFRAPITIDEPQQGPKPNKQINTPNEEPCLENS